MSRPPRRLKWTTVAILILRGWRPKRNVWNQLRLPDSLEVFPEAQRILSSYGGLTFGNRSDHAVLDSAAANEAAPQIEQFETLAARRFYPLGYREHQDREYLLTDERGLIYLLTGGELWLLAPSFERALDLIIGSNRLTRGAVEAELRAAGVQPAHWELMDSS